LRLAALLAAVALATSRLGLLAHELVGHGGAALVLGAHILEVRLFWFAGGWIHYQLPAGTVAELLAISMAGIAVELVCGLAIVVSVRGSTLPRRIVRGVGAALVLHGSWYLATGAWSGFGDGIILYRVLGDGRYPVAIAAGALTCTAAYVGARGVFGALSATVGRRVVATCIAIALAAGLHVALAVAELRVRRDPAYGQVMQPERERLVARELDRWTREQGSAATDDTRAREQSKLEAQHRTFPFAWLLAISAGLAAILGARKSKPGDGELPLRLVAIAACAAGIAIGAVIAIDVLTR
jgi:hypothetical protein